MEQTFAANRRQFLKGSVAASLVISFNLPMPKRVAAASAREFVPNAFLRIAPDNTITVISKHIEFG
jgi:isoquinoline 1-oxidoreductase beta subunit